MAVTSSGESPVAASIPTHGSDIVSIGFPAALTPLIGRSAELAELQAMLQRPEVRLICLTGPGGVGKTRLALALATRVTDHFPDGVNFVPLAAVTETELVFHAIAQALRVHDVSHQSALDTIARVLRGRRSLIVLDNFEQVRDAAPGLSALLASCPRIKIVVTSRVVLRLQSEYEFPVPPMLVPDSDEVDQADMVKSDAIQLFAQRARAVRHDFQLTGNNLPAIAEICRQLDGLPLAIELAATRARLMSASDLLDRLSNRLGLLTGGPRDLPARQQALRATISWSYDLLSPAERALFRQLAVFAGGWTLESAESVVDIAAELDVLDGLATLVDHHLVRRVEQPNGAVRFFMLETILEFAREELGNSRDEAPTRYRHFRHCLELAERMRDLIRSPRTAEALPIIEAETGNLRAALAWALEQDDRSLAQALAGELQWYWWAQNYFREGLEWLARAITRGPGEPSIYGQSLIAAGALAFRLGEGEQALVWLNESVAIMREIEDTRMVGFGLMHIANVRAATAGITAAQPVYAEALDCLERGGDRWMLSLALSYYGAALFDAGEPDEAMRQMTRAVRIAREVGAQSRLSSALTQIGFVAQSRRDSRLALESLREAFGLEWTRQAAPYLSEYLLHLGALLQDLGRPDPAGRLFGAAASAAEASGHLNYTDRLTHYRATIEAAKRALGDEPFETVWSQGAALDHQGVLDLVESELSVVTVEPAPRSSTTPGRDTAFGLTPREIDVLRLLAAGKSSQEIAETLAISAHTVKRHIANILGKLDVSSRAAAVSLAFQHKII